MSVFLGRHQNRLDAKGRVSIPAGFRTTLRARAQAAEAATESNAVHVILRPSHKYPCIEAWPADKFAELARPLDRLEMFSDDHDDLAAAIYADAYPTDADKEGRIMLPEPLTAHANITDSVAFIGWGEIFHIWEPQAGERRVAEARARAVNLPARRTAAP